MALVFDAVYNNSDVIRKVRECEKVFAELGNTAEIQGKRIDAAFEKISLKSLERAIEIMKNFPKEVQGISSFQRQIDGLEKHIERVNQRIASVGNGKLGSTFSDVSGNVNIGNVLKEQVYIGAQAVNTLTDKIISQRKAVREATQDVNTLAEAYKKAGKDTDKGKALFVDLTGAKSSLQKEKDALFELQTQQAQARLSVRKLRDEQRLYQKSSQDLIESNEKMALSFKKTLAAIGGVAALKQLGTAIIEARAEMQQLEKSFEVLLGSKTKSDVFVKEIKDYALISPLSVSDVSKAAQTLLGFGVAGKQVIPTIKMLGDVSMGNSQRFSSLALAFAQVQAAGKLTGNDMLQLVNAGFNPLKIISEKTGKSMSDLKKEMSDGSISAKMVADAFKSATEQGGQFYGMIEKNADGIRNAQNVLQGAIQETLNKIGEQNEGLIQGGYKTATYLIENYDKIGKVIAGLIVTFGSYRAALILNDVVNGNILAHRKLASVLIAAKNAQLALNKAIKGHPFLLLGSIILGVIASIYTFNKVTNEVSESQKRLSKASIDLNAEIGKETKIAKDLFDKLKKAKEGTKEYSDAKQNILDNYGKYISGMNKELDTMEKVKAAYNESTQAIKLYVSEKLKAQFVNEGVGDASGRQAEALKMIREALNKKYTSFGDAIKGEYNPTKESEAAFNAVKELLAKDDISGAGKLLFKDYGMNFMGDAGKGLEQYKNAAKEIKQVFKDADDLYSFKSDSPVTQSNITKEVTDATNKITTLKKEITELRNGKLKVAAGETVKSVIDSKVKELQDAEKVLETLTGKSTKQDKQQESLRSQQEKYNLLMDKQKLDRQRQNEDLENQAAQAEIDTLSDGFDKVQAQRDLNNKKEIQALKRQKEDYIRATIQAEKEKFDAQEDIKAKQIKGYKKQTFDTSTVKVDASKYDRIIENTKTSQGLNEWEQREASMNEYLLKYGTFSQKKEAIDKKYRDAISKETDLGQKNSLQKEWDESLSNLDLSKLRQEINWEMIFGDLSKVSKKSLNEVKQQLKVFKDSDEYKNMTVDQKKVIDEALNNIQSTIIDKGGLLGDLPEQLDALRIAQEELAKAQEEYNNALDNGTDTEKEAALKKKNKAEKNVQNAEVNVTKSADKTKQNLITLADTITQLGDSSEMSLSQIGSLASGLIDTFTEAGSKIGGIVGAAFSLLDAIDKQGLDGFIENVFSSVFKAVTSVWDTITFGAFSKITGSGDSDKNLERDIEYLTQSNQDLKSSLDNLSEKMDKASVVESNDIYKVQKENLEKQEYNTREAMQRSGAAYSNGFMGIGGSHSSNDKINKGMSSSEWSRVSNIVDSSVRDAGQFFQLSSEQMAKLAEEDTSLYSKIKDLANNGYKDAAQYMDEYITYYKQLEELENAHNEKLTNTSFDSVRDDFKNALLDMESDAEDFTANFEKMMQNAIMESLMTKKYDALIQAWYDDFAKAMEGDGKIDEAEQRDLKTGWDDIVNKGIAERNALKEAMGWEYDSGSSREASQKGIATASQDSVDENNGRLTVIQGHTYGINENVTRMATGIDTIATHTVNLSCLTNIDKTMQSLLTMRNESLAHLSSIANYTSNLVEMREYMHSMKQGIDTLNTKGLTLKR